MWEQIVNFVEGGIEGREMDLEPHSGLLCFQIRKLRNYTESSI